eukprot:1820925-Pyramimonas_sp.AAC.1
MADEVRGPRGGQGRNEIGTIRAPPRALGEAQLLESKLRLEDRRYPTRTPGDLETRTSKPRNIEPLT